MNKTKYIKKKNLIVFFVGVDVVGVVVVVVVFVVVIFCVPPLLMLCCIKTPAIQATTRNARSLIAKPW